MKIGLIAGGGQFPIIFAKKAKKKGYAVHAACYNNEADPILKQYVDSSEWLHLGQLKRLIKYFKSHDVTEAVMMGSIKKTRIFSDVKPDLKCLSIITGMAHTHDDSLLRTFAGVLEKENITIQSSTFLLPELLAQKGCWTKRKPNKAEKSDIDIGWKIVKEIGKLDIGQSLVVGGGSVLAVEAIDGTDATIKRGGNLAKGMTVVVKACKPIQDTRFDIPAIGAETIEVMHEAGSTALAMEAQKAVVFDKDKLIELANKYNIAVIAI